MKSRETIERLVEQTGVIKMKRHLHSWTLVTVSITALALMATVSAGWARDRDTDETAFAEARKEPGPSIVEIKDARLKIELNATDGDAGIQVFIDADPWKYIDIHDPFGKRIFRSITRGRFARQGGTELFLESAEPEFSELPLEEFLERFPEGEYRFSGRGLEGERFVGTASLTHNLPDGPLLVSPLEGGDPVDPNNTVVMWEPVVASNDSPIIGYQVLVVQPNSSFPAIPKIVLDVMMPATTASMTVPPGFLLPDTEYEWEVLAIESSGNQTLSSSFFRTASR